MIDNISIDFSLSNIWRSWYQFRNGKKQSQELDFFSYYLEKNLWKLWHDLNDDIYSHGSYRIFIVTDNKKRKISVASIRDRVVHRLIYEYLVSIYDDTFYYDVWSCRKNKGLIGAIDRTQKFLSAYPQYFVWRADITKFFDNVNQKVLIDILGRKIADSLVLKIIIKIINSYSARKGKGIPIGNLTSQIFANIYFNEFDRFVAHCLKPTKYLRYGDDFIIITENMDTLKQTRIKAINFLENTLHLNINSKNDIMVKAKQGLHFLGVEIFPNSRKLNKRNLERVKSKLNLRNIPSYYGLMKKHSKGKEIEEFNWEVLNKLENDLLS